MTDEITLTEEQHEAVKRIKEWFAKPGVPEFRLGGYAGTGKTTVIKHILKSLEECEKAVCAFTGKAVNVLNKKGVHAQTIHSLIYDVEVGPKGTVSFHKKTKLDGHVDLIIVDEASMISTEIYNDLVSFKKKYLFVGDPGQLEPVGDNPNLMAVADFVLKKIHRQAEKSPIISLANNVRLGGSVMHPDCDELIIRNKMIKTSDCCAVDQVICAKNKTRLTLNEKIRQFKQLPSRTLVQGDKIIVLQNNQNYNIFNGMILYVDEIVDTRTEWWEVNAHDEIGRLFHELLVWRRPFEQPESLGKEVVVPRHEKIKLVYADFGYAITCHKSQGSEWDSVLVWDEWMPPQVWDMKRWRYTAITRAAKKLIYCM